ncbi:MAG: hypothetical protein AAGG48_28540 [Planctomycetota bacterium]
MSKDHGATGYCLGIARVFEAAKQSLGGIVLLDPVNGRLVVQSEGGDGTFTGSFILHRNQI